MPKIVNIRAYWVLLCLLLLTGLYWALLGLNEPYLGISEPYLGLTLPYWTFFGPYFTLIGHYRTLFGPCCRDILAKNVQVSPPEPGLKRQQAATPKCHWIISYIGLIVRTSIVDLRADTGQIYRNWNVSPRAFLHYFNENFNYFTQLPA